MGLNSVIYIVAALVIIVLMYILMNLVEGCTRYDHTGHPVLNTSRCVLRGW